MLISIVSRLALAVVLFGSGAAWGAPPVIIASLVIAGSIIPLALRRHGSLPSLALGESLDIRLAEMEDRYAQGLAELEEEYGTQVLENGRMISDLEGRLDYAERLLEAQRDRGMLPPRKHDPILTPL